MNSLFNLAIRSGATSLLQNRIAVDSTTIPLWGLSWELAATP